MALANCPECGASVSTEAQACPHCGLPSPSKPKRHSGDRDATAGIIALFLGPVGLWFKGQWAAGFAWLVMTLLLSFVTSGIAAPLCWIGMIVHAVVASPKR